MSGLIRLWQTIFRKKTPASKQQIYAVGSPEYNAQVVQMILSLNERIAGQGKRVPEKTAIDIIHLTIDEDRPIS